MVFGFLSLIREGMGMGLGSFLPLFIFKSMPFTLFLLMCISKHTLLKRWKKNPQSQKSTSCLLIEKEIYKFWNP